MSIGLIYIRDMSFSEKRTTQILIRVQPSLKDKMEAAARDEARSLSSFIEKVVSDWLRERGYLDPGPRELTPELLKEILKLRKDPESST